MKRQFCLPCFLELQKAGKHDIKRVGGGVNMKITCWRCKRRRYQTMTYTPVLLAPNKITTVDDLLERAAGENPYSGRTPAERAVEKLADDLRELNEMIVRREEWMAATSIFTGQIPIIGEGLNEVIDFNFTNTETIVTPGLKWNGADADPLADLERWRETVQKEGFVNCNICIMAKNVANAFVNNAKVKDVLDIKAYDLAVIKQSGGGSTVYGWVDAADVQAVSTTPSGSGTTTAPKMRVGARVKYSGPLYRDSNGNGQGKTVNGTYTVKYYYPGRKCGVHIDGLGWVPESACSVVG